MPIANKQEEFKKKPTSPPVQSSGPRWGRRRTRDFQAPKDPRCILPMRQAGSKWVRQGSNRNPQMGQAVSNIVPWGRARDKLISIINASRLDAMIGIMIYNFHKSDCACPIPAEMGNYKRNQGQCARISSLNSLFSLSPNYTLPLRGFSLFEYFISIYSLNMFMYITV
jgi:hypothetical protein